ncbi:hypothetical protein [Sulfitobacter sp. 1A15106]|uniref:hypothetical protein n=1 Tax=Sulfitobacter sp. 1A15106 TaxID=3368590 RepID=UPI0037462CC7
MSLESFRESLARSHSTHEKSVEIYLENSIMLPQDASEEARKAEVRTESYQLIKHMLELAQKHCEEQNLEPGSNEAFAAFDEGHDTATSVVHAYQGLSFSMEERAALTPEQVTEKMALLVPNHVTNLVAYVKEKGKLGVPQDWLSDAVGDYVSGRFKSPAVDRLLAQSLTQVEIVAYMDEMLGKSPLSGMSKLEETYSPSVTKAVWNFFKLISGVLLISFGIAALPMLFSALPADGMLLGGLTFGALGSIILLALLVLAIVGILREKPASKRRRQSILNMIDRMNGFFLEFKSSGPFSTAHFRKRVDDLAEAGVVWPSGLYVLLDDMEARGVRVF